MRRNQDGKKAWIHGLTHDGDIQVITEWVLFARSPWPQTQMIVTGGLDQVRVVVATSLPRGAWWIAVARYTTS